MALLTGLDRRPVKSYDRFMNSVSVSQLKASPAKVIDQASDYPVAVRNRNKISAYVVGKQLYEKMVAYMENYIDKKAVDEADFSKGKDLEKLVEELEL